MKLPIYLDYASTTPVDPRVVDKMMQYLTLDGIFGNPASYSHRFGWQAEEAVDIARNQIAELINAEPREIVFTSGATESDNLAIKGAAYSYKSRGNHIITSQTEHKAVLDSCLYLEREGFEVTFLKPNRDGIITPDILEKALRDVTVLVSLMHVNNETGIIQDIEALGKICRIKDILFHVDAAQSFGKVPINIRKLPIDLLSCSAHKIYGPKGIGALWIRRKPFLKIDAQMHGGGHERGMRSGTLPVHQIVGMGEACHIARKELNNEEEHLKRLRQCFWDGISVLKNISINGSLTNGLPNILNVSFIDIEGESLMMALKDLALSSGSACTSAILEPSYVLRAMGIEYEQARSSLRFSFGRFTTEEEINYSIKLIKEMVKYFRTSNNI